MRAVVQRVRSASVAVQGEVVGRCGPGMLILAAAHREDSEADARKLAEKIAGLRIFADSDGKMNLSLADLPEAQEPQVLAVSQFTLYGDALKSRRPSFVQSAPYEEGKHLFEVFVSSLRPLVRGLETGVFGAMMEVSLVNDGPVTLILDVGPARNDSQAGNLSP
jgi:D-aminoacyl-tRNA deacylase